MSLVQDIHWRTVIIDEAHRLKATKGATRSVVTDMDTEWLLLLTGQVAIARRFDLHLCLPASTVGAIVLLPVLELHGGLRDQGRASVSAKSCPEFAWILTCVGGDLTALPCVAAGPCMLPGRTILYLCRRG